MRRIKEKLNNALIQLKVKADTFMMDETGDTNFISIAIIMVIVIGVAVAFILFKDRLMAAFTTATEDLFGSL